MGLYVSTLTQFLPQGDSFTGEFTAAPSNVWGANPTFGSKEYLQTGFTKPYTSAYASLADNLRTVTLNDEEVAFSSQWAIFTFTGNFPANSNYVGPTTFYSTGGYFHAVQVGSGPGAFTSGAPTPSGGFHFAFWNLDTPAGYTSATVSAQIAQGIYFGPAPRLPAGCVSSTYFKSYIVTSVFGYDWSLGDTYGRLLSSNSTTYTSRAQVLSSQPGWVLSASNSLVVGLRSGADQSAANSCYTSTDSVNFTATAANTNFQTSPLGGIAHFAYSQCGNTFIVVTNNGTIYTADGGNGLTYTLRTSPTGMPTSGITYGAAAELNYCAGTATETYISLGAPDTNRSFLLKTTDGTSFTLTNLIDTAPALRGLLVGFAGATPWINYADNKYFLNYGALVAFSTDNGNTWTLDYTKYRSSFTSGVLTPGGSFFKFKWGAVAGKNQGGYGDEMYGEIRNSATTAAAQNITGNGGRIVYMNKRYALSTPQLIGATSAVTFATGTNYSTYLRIK
jgi:hypothetical protein